MATPDPDDPRRQWSWRRLARIVLFTVAGLALIDASLLPLEDRIADRAPRGALRNTHGAGIADACRWMLLEQPEARGAVVFAGSSVTFGSGLAPQEAIPAQLHRRFEAMRIDAPVFNCAAAGGSPTTSIPIAAALSDGTASALVVEVLAPSYVRGREGTTSGNYSPDEKALLLEAGAERFRILARAGSLPGPTDRVENTLASLVRRHWLLYRLRGSLWIDDTLMPNLLVWTLRREAAAVGLLPKRFHGQTTNVGKLPWREAYVGGQRPGGNQRFQAPTDEIADSEIAALFLTQELADAASVPVLFYDAPLNLAFQRHFELMTDEEIDRLARARDRLLDRLEQRGLRVVRAPPVDDEDFLDKAHLTPRGAEKMAAHLAPAVAEVLSATHSRSERTESPDGQPWSS